MKRTNVISLGPVSYTHLYQDPQLDALTGTVGIAHTRWATHGKPSKENSHHHLDSRGVFTVVHNGIIAVSYTHLDVYKRQV